MLKNFGEMYENLENSATNVREFLWNVGKLREFRRNVQEFRRNVEFFTKIAGFSLRKAGKCGRIRPISGAYGHFTGHMGPLGR